MRLKRLEIRGFKTFANPVTLEFVSPITAIVGPNGSGKSNIADAVRWALGEQSARALRTKRTEDVIYGGGNGRAQLGMAEVALTLDNEDGWLGLPFAEVCLARRAYRSGDNEYYINGARARLRDLADLVLKANAGPSGYTVIGQGMVDLALSLRPEERRFLFEEAADVKRHYLKIKEAQDKLAATEDNMRRVADLAAELAPRLATLERQAERARRHAALAAELRDLLLRWYRHQWCRAQAQLAQAEAEEGRALAALAAVEDDLAALAAADSALADRRTAVGRDLAALGESAAALAREGEKAQLALAVGRERSAGLADRRAQIERRLGEVDAARERTAAQLSQVEAERERLAAEKAEATGEAERLAAAVAASQGARAAEQRALMAAERELERLTEAWAQTGTAVARLGEQRAAAAREGERQRRALAEGDRRLAAAEGEATAGAEHLAKLAAALAALGETLAAGERATAAAEAELANAERGLEQARRERQTAQGRLAMLERWQHDLSGYNAGARAVLHAARTGRGERLAGIVGVVAALLRVPAEVELAVEVALGGRLQDVVVARWDDAEAAIAYLKRTRAGRATFLPLDTIRQLPPQRPPSGPGILGVACDLVQYDAAHAVVARHLLGRTLVVRDLPTARRALDACPPGWQIVTLAGEVVRQSGAVTGGTLGPQQAGLLGQERELRELPATLAALDRALLAAEQTANERRAALREARAAAAQLVRQEREAAAQRQRLEGDLAALRREVERLRRERSQAAIAVRASEADLAAATRQVERATEELADLAEAREAARGRVEAARAALAAAEAADGDAARRLAEAQAAQATAERAEARLAQQAGERQQDLDRLAAEAAALAAEGDDLAAQTAALAEELAAAEAAARALAERRAALAEREGACRADLAAVEAEAARLEARRREAYAQQTARSAALAAAQASVQRARADLAALRERIGGDSGLEPGDGPRQLRLPWEEEPAALAATEEANPELLRRQIEQVRAQLRNLAAVNPDAVRDYEELAARHAFLAAQHADLQQAARALRQAIADLEQTMRRQFAKTFSAIAAEFRRTFAALFGGGTARLTLTQPDDLLETGVEITAQPPGKRRQSLVLLSGGERALTAVALLFAILRVKPAPFCVLDEIDAALDDANVARCADMLASLADRTQFVVITHNRLTMQAAGALYGVAIGQDGVSRLVSLRLEEVPAEQKPAADRGAPTESPLPLAEG